MTFIDLYIYNIYIYIYIYLWIIAGDKAHNKDIYRVKMSAEHLKTVLR